MMICQATEKLEGLRLFRTLASVHVHHGGRLITLLHVCAQLCSVSGCCALRNAHAAAPVCCTMKMCWCGAAQVPLMTVCRALRTDKRRPWLGNAVVLGTTAFGQAAAVVAYAQALGQQ